MIMDKIIENDRTKKNQCAVVTECNWYESNLDPSIRKVWKCDGKDHIIGGK